MCSQVTIPALTSQFQLIREKVGTRPTNIQSLARQPPVQALKYHSDLQAQESELNIQKEPAGQAKETVYLALAAHAPGPTWDLEHSQKANRHEVHPCCHRASRTLRDIVSKQCKWEE